MNRIKFSFVIPVYNVKDWLEQCVNSVLSQNYDPNLLEIILVDDGSVDGSGSLCDSLAEKCCMLAVTTFSFWIQMITLSLNLAQSLKKK